MTKKSIFIRALEWAEHENPFTEKELREGLALKKDSAEWIHLAHFLPRTSITHSGNYSFIFRPTGKVGDSDPRGEDGPRLYMMSYDDQFRLLEYRELSEARKTSRHAWWFSFAAIAISLFSLGLQRAATPKVEITNFPAYMIEETTSPPAPEETAPTQSPDQQQHEQDEKPQIQDPPEALPDTPTDGETPYPGTPPKS